MKIAYNHLVKYIQEKPSIKQISESLFQLGHEHEIEGNIFDMEFTPNRGDCLSINGLLRDLAVFYEIKFEHEIYKEQIAELDLDFENQSKNICPQISFLKLEINTIPELYKKYLEEYFTDLAINKNNFFTDVSNYLSYETGQPTHCYDANKINDRLIFHEIDSDEEFETLLGKKIKLSGKNAVFSLNKKSINLAGIVGGMSTSCSTETKTVLVECAYFKPEAIVGKSVKYDIQSDASHKFERGVDPSCQNEVLRRFIKIVSDHTNIKDISIMSYKFKKDSIHKIPINVNKINKIIGTNITKEYYLDCLLKLGFSVDNDFITVPSFRSDIKTNNDLAEEVARVIGYDNIDLLNFDISSKSYKNSNREIEDKIRYFLLDHGFYEVINTPFVNNNYNEALRVDNPLDSNREYLRTNIVNSLLENLLYNEKRQKDSVKLFEISDIYFFKNGIEKKRKLAIIGSGRVGLNYEDFSKKINENYMTQIFKEVMPNTTLDFKKISRDSLDSKIKSEIISLEIDIDDLSSEILKYKEISSPPNNFIRYIPISEQPSSFKDISYLLEDVGKINDLQDLLLNYECEIIKNVYIFDYYNNLKKEEVKIGFRFIFQANKITLTAAEIDVVYNDIISKSLNIDGVKIPGI